MKKWTKVLSSFVVAAVMSTGIVTAVGCGGDDDDKGHEHNYSQTWSSDKDNHWHECLNDGCDAKEKDKAGHVDIVINENKAAGEDGLCDECGYKIKDVTPAPGPDEGDEVDISDGKIATVAEFLAFRQLGEVKEGNYVLEADIDLAGVELPDAKVVLSGTATFDGQGHMIMNGSYAAATSKTGLLFKTIKGASVTNVKFLNCTVTSTVESSGMLTGTIESADGTAVEDKKATVSKIEFNSCSIAFSGANYGGFVYGRNESPAYFEISEITAKNGVVINSVKGGGIIGGYSNSKSTINLHDLDIDGKVNASGDNASFLTGRGDGNIIVKNAVLKVDMNNASNNGIFAGYDGNGTKQGQVLSVTLDNILIVSTNNTSICKAMTVLTTNKIYSVGETPLTLTTAAGTNSVNTEVGQNTVAFLTDTLGFDFTNVWTAEGDGYRLKAASTNVKSDDATLNSLKVSSVNAKLRYKIEEAHELSTDGLLVMGVYSDGVQLVLTEGETADYTVDASGIDWTKAGKYKVTVKGVGNDITAEYEIEVVQQTGFKVYQDRMAHVYLEGAKLDEKTFSVKSTWTDGKEETLKLGTDYTITGYDLNVAGKYTAKVNNKDFPAQDIEINVVKYIPVPVGGVVYVNVDKNYNGDNGAADKGIVNFNELGDAIAYLEACKLNNDVTKIVYVGEGSYAEHIETNLNNLTLIGKGKDKTILTCSNVQSTFNPLKDKAFGLNENATLIVNGENFKAYGLAIRNDFDYPANGKNESSPQGTALMINGDRAIISDCLLYGNQDTLFIKSGRTYFKDTEIQGNIDFIFGEEKGIAYFDNCTIRAINKSATDKGEKNNGYVTAMKVTADKKPDYGYIFDSCTFTDDGHVADGAMSLGRPWGPAATVAMVNCSFTKAYSTAAYNNADGVKPRWYDMSGNSPVDADFKEYGSTGEGAIKAAVAGGSIMTEEQAALHTKANIFAADNGKCSWTADWTTYETELTTLRTHGGWTFVAPSEFAYDVDGVEFGDNGEIIIVEGKEAKFGLAAGPWNSDDKTVEVSVLDPTVATWENGVLKGLKKGTTTLTVSKTGIESIVFTIVVEAAEGVETEAKTYTFDYSKLPTLTDKTALEAGAMKGEGNEFITVGTGVTYRTNGGGCLENKDGGLSVTFQGTGTLTITFASTGDANISRLGIKNEAGEWIAASTVGEGATLVTNSTEGENGSYSVGNGLAKPDGNGTVKVTMVFTISESGTYTIVCPSKDLGRGARIHNIVMVDNVPKTGGSTVEKHENVTMNVAEVVTAGTLTASSNKQNISATTLVKGIVLTLTDSKVEEKSITIGDNTFSHRIVLGKPTSSKPRNIAIQTEGACTIKVYVANTSGKDENRDIGLYTDITGATLVAGTTKTSINGLIDSAKLLEYSITDATTCYLVSTVGDLAVYQIEVIYNS